MNTRRSFIKQSAAALAVAGCGSAWAKEQPTWTPKLATSSVMFQELPIEKIIEITAGLGLSGLDIWGPFGKCRHLEDIKERLGGRGLRRLMDQHKLELAAFSVYPNRYSDYWGMIRDFGGGIVVRGSTKKPPKDPAELVPAMKAFFEELKPQIELAEKGNARLAIENHGNDLLNTIDSFKAFVDLNPNPKRVGIALAPYHLQQYKTPMETFIKTAGSQCLFFYAWQRGRGMKQMPGHGPADFAPWLRALSEINYPHYSTVFMHGHPPTEEMKAAVAKSRKYLLATR